MNNAWDKFLLIAASVVVIGFSGLFITKALSYNERFEFEEPNPDNTIQPTDIAIVKGATGFVKEKQIWTLPMKGNPPKEVPLFVSIPIIETNGELIDMTDPNSPKLREPVPNKWLLDNNLDFLNAGVLGQDTDGDGFSNLEEFNFKSDPNSPQSHPPYVGKLYLKQRLAKVYRLKFAAQPDEDTFQIVRLPTAAWPGRQETMLMSVGDTSKDNQFRVESFEAKEAERNGITVDASVVEITYIPTGKKWRLVRNTEQDIPTYFGELSFKLGTVEPQYIKEGDTFTLSTDNTSKYRLVEIEPDSAKISVQDASGEEKIVEIGKES
ncbi:MAG: hypothetical protein HKN23_21040 [Verrucomicrobiales bacterium]|nr:hypothetical protein [Verrucomicrobiales bacterium]